MLETKTSEPRMRNRGEVMRDEMVMRDRIKEILKDGSLTLPELVEAMSAPAWEVTMWVMAMRRYGLIEEEAKSRADDYYRYRLNHKPAQGESNGTH